jgi:hypothetical protein
VNPNSPIAPSTPTPEENAALQALENSEVTSVEMNVPVNIPAPAPIPPPAPPSVPAPTPAMPIVGQDIVPTPPKVAPAPVIDTTPPNNLPLGDDEPAVTTPHFNPFEARALELSKKRKKKSVVIFAVILLLAGLAAGGYYAWTFLQSAATPPVTVPATSEEESADQATIETPEDVTNEIEAIEEDLNTIDDSKLEDTTISDETLNQ